MTLVHVRPTLRGSMDRSTSQPASPAPAPAQRTLAPGRLLWWGLAALALVAGYADLWRGGETLAPVLLVLGYVVLIPVAILRR